jgi:NAD(P)-dependent dehydrogenase (short-subunit alcohol dehydrogenase family)
LFGRVALVTGASSGIGRVTALELAKAGANVVLAARREALLNEVAELINLMGRRSLVVRTDVTSREQVEHLVAQTIDHFGSIDILVVSAGDYPHASIQELTIPQMEHAMAVHFYGGIYTIKAVLPHMLEQNRGHIVIVSTMNVFLGLPGDVPYVAAKAALSGFGEVLRQELHGTNVRTTTLFPGRVATPFIEHLDLPWISNIIPPEHVARWIVKAISRRQIIVISPFLVKIMYLVKVLVPRLADWIIRVFNLQGRKTSKDKVKVPDL